MESEDPESAGPHSLAASLPSHTRATFVFTKFAAMLTCLLSLPPPLLSTACTHSPGSGGQLNQTLSEDASERIGVPTSPVSTSYLFYFAGLRPQVGGEVCVTPHPAAPELIFQYFLKCGLTLAGKTQLELGHRCRDAAGTGTPCSASGCLPLLWFAVRASITDSSHPSLSIPRYSICLCCRESVAAGCQYCL